MTTLTKTLIALTTATSLLALSLPSYSATTTHVESALVDICKAAKSNKVYKLHSTIKSYGLNYETVASKVVCNGDDIITFSEKRGAIKTAAKLEQSLLQNREVETKVSSYAKNL